MLLRFEWGCGTQGLTALMYAVDAYEPKDKIVDKLLSCGANVDARDTKVSLPRACTALRQMCELLKDSNVTRALLALLWTTLLHNVAGVNVGHAVMLLCFTLADHTM